jgi:hypothetical protein
MDFQVEMLAFGDHDEIRIVSIPEDKEQSLENVFYYGQNDFQPKPHPSVSVGDVINYENEKYLVAGIGFKKLNQDEYENYKSLSRRERILTGF